MTNYGRERRGSNPIIWHQPCSVGNSGLITFHDVPRSLYSWTKSWCSPKTKTKTRFLNVKRNFLATERPTERSASRCAHSPEITSFSLRAYIYVRMYIYTYIYTYKRVVCSKQTERSSFRLELFGVPWRIA